MNDSVPLGQGVAPAIQTLNFASNCTVVKSYLASWFDISGPSMVNLTKGGDTVVNITNSGLNATFWIPESLDEAAALDFWTAALPSNLAASASYGDILQWSYTLRRQYADDIQDWLDEWERQNETTALPPPATPFFDYTIDKPNRACSHETCELGFSLERYADLNGPGIFIFYHIQTVIATIYALIVTLRALVLLSPGLMCGIRPYTGMRRKRSANARIDDSFVGFADAVALAGIALPSAVLVGFTTSHEEHILHKELLLLLWVFFYWISSSLWVQRLNAAIYRLKRNAVIDTSLRHPGADKSDTFFSWATSAILYITILYSIILMVCIWAYNSRTDPIHFEEYWDDVCQVKYSITERHIGILFGALAIILVVRPVALIIYGRCVKKARHRKELEKHSNYRTVTNWLAIWDSLAFVGLSWAVLSYLRSYRYQLLDISWSDGLSDNWSLGQVLAVAAIAPAVFALVRLWDKS